MLKVILTLACLMAVACVAIADDEVITVEGCESEDELWGSVDGTKFYFCLPGTDIGIQQDCPPDTFFVKNATVTGCLPVEFVNPSCTNLEPVGICEGDNLVQPQASSDPTMFYLCTQPMAMPVLMPCESGKAFLREQYYLGCFDWALWRQIRQCAP